jgi:phospholipid-binding lipoprotein MlaA
MDWQVDPFFYQSGRSYNILTQSVEQSIGVKTFEYFNEHSGNIEAYEALKKGAVDLYPLFKDVYEQRRAKEIAE